MEYPTEYEGVDVVILCGGRGRRLGYLTSNTPKPLIPVAGKPMLFQIIEQLEDISVRKLFLIGKYRKKQIEQAILQYKWTSKPVPEICVIDQIYPESEGAVLTGVGLVETSKVLVLCGDDLIGKSVILRLISAEGAGALMSRYIKDSSLPRLVANNNHIVSTGKDNNDPIMTYNLCLNSDLLREWSNLAVENSCTMVECIESFISEKIYIVDGSESISINTSLELSQANHRLQKN